MIQNKDYQYTNMASAVYGLQRSFQDTDQWTFELVKTSSTSMAFMGNYVATATHKDLPYCRFVVFSDAQYFFCGGNQFFDILEGDEFFGEHVTVVFSDSQKETLRKMFLRSSNCISIVSKMMKEQGIEIHPYKNAEQKAIAETFNGIHKKEKPHEQRVSG